MQQREAGGGRLQEARKKQRIDPRRAACQHAADGARAGGAAPEQAAEKRRRELRDRREDNRPMAARLGIAEPAIVEVGHRHDGENRNAADGEQEVAEILAARKRFAALLQHQRHHDIFETMIEARRIPRSPWRSPPTGSDEDRKLSKVIFVHRQLSTYMSLSTAANGGSRDASAIGIPTG